MSGSMPNEAIYMLVGFVVVLIVMVVIAFVCNKKERDREAEAVPPNYWDQSRMLNEAATVEGFLNDMAKEKSIRFSPLQLSSFTWNYSKRLGSGGFGVVYKGRLPNGVPIAVKVLNNNSAAEKKIEEQFMGEVSTIGRTYHNNLVKLYGYCFHKKMKALVYEYMENGSLDNILFGNKISPGIEWEKLYEIAIGTAKGLTYLHEECEQRIIHYDIKPGNVLLDAKLCPRVADFGLAKLCNRDITHVTLTHGRGTPGYAAPELWMPFPVTYKCDVYSFGIMLFEILGRSRNIDIINESERQEYWFPIRVWDKFERGELGEMMLECGIEEKDKDKAKVMFMVALWCVQYLPQARPSMSSVVKILEGGGEVTSPPNPFQHLVSSGVDLAMSSATSTDSTREGASESSYKDSTPIMSKYEIEVATSS